MIRSVSINVYTIIYLIELGVLAPDLEMGPPLESHIEAAGVEVVAAFVPVVEELVGVAVVEPVAAEPVVVVAAVAELVVVPEVQAVLEPYA